MAIKQFITLEGAEQVVANLKKISDAGEQALTKFRESGAQFVPTDQFTNSLNQTSRALTETGVAAGGLTESLHVMRPILEEVGLRVGNIREFSILARGGIEGLALAIGGALVIAAAKAADEFKSLQANMQFLFGADLGGKLAANAKQLATDLGTSTANVAPALESIALALSRVSSFRSVGAEPGQFFKGLPQDADKAKAAVDALSRQLELLGQTGAQALPQVAAFFASIGKIDPKTLQPVGLTLQNFLTLAPQIQQALDNAFGGHLLERLQTAKNQTIEFQKVLDTLARADVSISIKPIDKNVAQSLEELKTSATELLAALGDAGATQAFKELSAGVREAVGQINQANFGPLKTQISSTEQELNGLNTAFQNAGKAAHDFIMQGAQPIAPFGPELGAPQPGVFDAIKINFKQSMDELEASASSAWEKIKQIFSDGTQQIQADLNNTNWSWENLVSSAQTAFQRIQSAFQTLMTTLQQAAGQGISFESQFSPGGGGAAGGLVTGPGSSTSDSIIARLSNFEYVMRAAAVKFYGVDFMHALNAMRLPKDFFRGFNLGGLVLPPFPSPPRFAQGGLAMAGQSRPLTLVLDGRSFAVAGSKNVVDDLERAADLHNLSRIGRAPGWIR